MTVEQKPIDVLVAGHICLDIIPRFDADGRYTPEFLAPGRLVQVGAPQFFSGGPVANTGLSLSRLGARVELRGLLGKDSFGRSLLEVLKSENESLAEGMLVDGEVSTSYSVVLSPPGLDRIFIHSPGANDSFDAHRIDFSRVEKAKIFHFGYPTVMRQMYEDGGSGLLEIMRRAKKAGAVTSLDLTMPDPESPGGKADWGTIFSRVLPFVDLFLPSLEEILMTLFPWKYQELGPDPGGKVTQADLHEIAGFLLDLGVKIVVIKRGNRGLYLETSGESAMRSLGDLISDPEVWSNCQKNQNCLEAKVVGTTGAGDAAIAGFLYSLVRGADPEKALKMASAVGACNVEAADALGGIRSWKETEERLRNGWKEEECR